MTHTNLEANQSFACSIGDLGGLGQHTLEEHTRLEAK